MPPVNGCGKDHPGPCAWVGDLCMQPEGPRRETANIKDDYCGQKQPHAAHTWETPRGYASTAIATWHQCAGVSDG